MWINGIKDGDFWKLCLLINYQLFVYTSCSLNCNFICQIKKMDKIVLKSESIDIRTTFNRE